MLLFLSNLLNVSHYITVTRGTNTHFNKTEGKTLPQVALRKLPAGGPKGERSTRSGMPGPGCCHGYSMDSHFPLTQDVDLDLRN